MNVYDSLKAWPADTEITALRVLQVFPMSVPSVHRRMKRVCAWRLPGTAIVPVRHVLGTVPVEKDGSVHLPRAGQQRAVLPGAQ